MNTRMYRSEDCKEIIELFYNTVHSVNAKDYNEAQLDVWASKLQLQNLSLKNKVIKW